jgi:AhpD family alkylhydroperoxidase
MQNRDGETGYAPSAGSSEKRTYGSFRELVSDIWFLFKNSPFIVRMTWNRVLSRSFQERLMLAVTSVYHCRYCTWVHTGAALASGMNREEISRILEGALLDCPEDETTAILYAQHWADTDANPLPQATAKLKQAYGPNKARAIQLVLRMIRVGNLTGNTWDCYVHRFTGALPGRMKGDRRNDEG